ncbi:MAG: hypothetical protein JSR21_18300 [Proteobacteria bacterium]|nr:hypothetical protein [Pseudomonadota bacterium]
MIGLDGALLLAIAAGVVLWLICTLTGCRWPRATGAPTAPDVPRIMCTGLTAVAVMLSFGAACFYVLGWPLSRLNCTQLVLVSLLAGAVAYGELISRYRDDPRRLLGNQATALYIAVNISAAIAALALVKLLKVFDKQSHIALWEVLLASFGAVAFFRTSLFTARVGGTDIGVGPSTLLKSLLDACDLVINRTQASTRADQVTAIMQGVVFDKAKTALPTLCMTLVEGFPDDQNRQLGEQIAKLDQEGTIAADAKTIVLGGYLIRQFGADVLARAVSTLGSRIK